MRIREMFYFDDDFMTKCFEDFAEAAELVLRLLLNDNKLVVKELEVQAVIKNLQGRSIRMDVKANDEVNKYYDIEVQ